MASHAQFVSLSPVSHPSTPGSIVRLTLSTLGCTVTHLVVLDRNGIERDVVLGFDSNEKLKAAMDSPGWGYVGSTVGRVANRISNGRFSLDGVKFEVTQSQSPNTLHGGGPTHSYDQQLFNIESTSQSSAKLSLRDVHDVGNGGFPGTLDVTVSVEVHQDEVVWTYHAHLVDEATEKNLYAQRGRDASEPVTKETPVAVTNHTYFNLSGMQDESVISGVQGWPGVTGSTSKGHVVHFPADVVKGVLEFDSTNIPTGRVDPLQGPMDFGTPRELSISSFPGDASKPENRPGWDHYFTVDQKLCGAAWKRDKHELSDFSLNPVVSVSSTTTGINLAIHSTEPGFQFYTSAWLDGMVASPYKSTQKAGTHGSIYGRYAGFAVEPQPYVDAVNHPEWQAQSVISRGGKGYNSKLVWKFSSTST
ncbi:galactose mutarotase-like protein [Gonapodya prolifera JEL478]|uniref:Galactose mutarotase-like protein n=1 Tax=Gonapodya prolifera (strain JEL478) TaxID=1344416 RepID=A0A139AUV2_GONPJ|nr:galactose mutarotase-like protein [Gonapodya prolifera JEL478]|eukprot:KXS20479.1 galactose mutarotase-like protein [Gonapodya prolifera JEL478]